MPTPFHLGCHGTSIPGLLPGIGHPASAVRSDGQIRTPARLSRSFTIDSSPVWCWTRHPPPAWRRFFAELSPRPTGRGETPWKCWRLLTLETRMQGCRRNSRQGSQPRVGTVRRRRPPRCGWSGPCGQSWALTFRSTTSRAAGGRLMADRLLRLGWSDLGPVVAGILPGLVDSAEFRRWRRCRPRKVRSPSEKRIPVLTNQVARFFQRCRSMLSRSNTNSGGVRNTLSLMDQAASAAVARPSPTSTASYRAPSRPLCGQAYRVQPLPRSTAAAHPRRH